VAWAGAQTPPEALTLQQAVAEAVANNLDLAAEKLNVSVAEAREITARLRPNPVLSVSGQTLNLLGSVLGGTFTVDGPLGPNQFNVHTEVPLERRAKRTNRIGVARAEKSLAELGVREVLRQIIAGVQNAFVDVQQANENLKLAQENLQRLDNVVTINEARNRAGDLSRVELDRSRLAALQYRAAVQQAQLQLDQAKIQLQQLMGRTRRTTAIDVAGELRRETLAEGLDGLTRLAVARRPDYLAAQQAQARSRADLQLQLANRKVDYSIGAEVSRQFAYGFAGNSLGLYVSVPLPIFNRNQGEIARAQREIQLFGARATALDLGIRTEVDRAYRQYAFSRQLLLSVETDMLAKARSVRDTTEYSYRRGEASLVEFLDAQRAFNDAMQTYNDARANYARSLYAIDTITGATVEGR
jgi:cobalt-zinc-cadmium efflux system outer membrane protein